MSEQKLLPVTIALAGQPNVGKSTVFNMLTGLNQHVGNWSGKTVEQKTGKFNHQGQPIHLVDLPGTYSLTANSEEERIARDFIIHEGPDVVVVILNAAALERNLYLVAELFWLPAPVVIGLNMLDVAGQHGIHVEAHVLQAALGAPVIPLVASKNQGLQELMDAALRLVDHPDEYQPNQPVIRPNHLPILKEIHSLIAGHVPPPHPEDWVALKLLEGDGEAIDMMRQSNPVIWESIHTLLAQHEDAYLDIAGGRYEWIGRMMRAAVAQPKLGMITLTDRLDKIATHPVGGVAVLLGIFGLVFWLTYTVATPIVSWIGSGLVRPLAEVMNSLLVPVSPWLAGLVVDGVITGAGTVLSFLPILIIFFATLGFLEDVGYVTRAAYVMDRYMHAMGLHGKSFMALFLGFGCNVPCVMCARIMEDRRSRLLTILLAPLVPCTGRLAVVAFLAPALFGQAAILVSWGLVAGNILLLALLGIAINRLVFKGAHTAFIMEMPLYHLPNARTIGLFVWNNTQVFVKKAGTIIVIFSGIVWLLSRLPAGSVDGSLLASLGRSLEPIGSWMGWGDWRLIVALLTSFVAKENTIATLGILFSANGSGPPLAAQVAGALSLAGGLAYMVVQMTFIPCAATMSVIRQETGSWKWVAFSSGLLLIVSLLAGSLVYQIANLF